MSHVLSSFSRSYNHPYYQIIVTTHDSWYPPWNRREDPIYKYRWLFNEIKIVAAQRIASTRSQESRGARTDHLSASKFPDKMHRQRQLWSSSDETGVGNCWPAWALQVPLIHVSRHSTSMQQGRRLFFSINLLVFPYFFCAPLKLLNDWW
jgi:hypothetical protein